MNPSHANPIITRLIDRPTWLTVRRSFWLTFGLGLISLFASSALMLSPVTFSPGWELILGWGVIILAPCLVTLLAVRATDGDLFTAVGFDRAPRTDGAAVRPRPGQRNRNRVLPRADVFEQSRPVVHIDNEDFRTPVTIQIARCQTPRRARGREAWTG